MFLFHEIPQFSLGALKVLSLSLVFNNLIMMYLGVEFVEFF